MIVVIAHSVFMDKYSNILEFVVFLFLHLTLNEIVNYGKIFRYPCQHVDIIWFNIEDVLL